MGKKIESVRQKSREGSDQFRKGAEAGQRAVSETKQNKKLIDSIPDDVDDEVKAAVKAVTDATKSDAENYMKGEVSASIESGKKSMSDSSKEAGDQVKLNERTQALFDQMDSVGSFGRNARAAGRGSVEASTREFNRAIQENEKAALDAEADHKRKLSEISGTF